MDPLTTLWAPIVLSAVVVFVASSIMHTVLPYHRSDVHPLPDEENVMAALRAAGLKRGLYVFPFCLPKNMKTPGAVEKYKQGPVGMMTIFPSGPPAMAKFLALWFAYCLIISSAVAFLAGSAVRGGAPYRAVFHVVAIAAFLAYGLANLANGIWRGQPWSVVTKEVIDGLIYALLTAGTFGWLWPR
jgi:hypothetical protein